MGILRRQGKQSQASEWIAPGQMADQPAEPDLWSGPPPRPIPARLRAVRDDGPGEWLNGALRLAPGSLLWEPDAEIRADPVELAASWAGPGPVLGPGRTLAMTTYVEPPTGRFELELEPEIFETFLEIAATPAGPTADPGAFSPPAN